MTFPKSLRKAQIVDWLLELIPVWEVPVTCSMLHKAHPEFSVPVYAGALKMLTEQGLLTARPGLRDQTFYTPQEQVKPCDIQVLICKGKLDYEQQQPDT
jgi:hypothetical protein